MSLILKPLELAYRGVNRARRALYARGLLSSRHLPRPVVSIGNLAMGGSGKTPTTIAIARRLGRDGYRVVVLSRGYGRSSDEIAIVEGTDVRRFGDEPVLMASKIAPAPVVVGADRFLAGHWFLRQGDCDLFLLDDGFQHLQLHRDVDVVLVDPASRWLREGESVLEDADLVVHREKPARHHSFVASLSPSAVRIGPATSDPHTLAGRRVFAFSGLANNSRFFDSLTALGAVVVARRGFEDHHRFTAADVSSIREQQRISGAELSITTEKDAVKIDDPSIAVLEVEMRIAPEEVFFGRLYDRLCEAGLRRIQGTL